MFVTFQGLTRPVHFDGCPELADALDRVLVGWPHRPSPSSADPAAVISREPGGYSVRSPYFQDLLLEHCEVDAVCSFVVDLVTAFIEARGLLCLHCASCEISGRLIVFPGSSKAGKSTLTARLAAEGYRIFGDDLVAIDPAGGDAVGLGVRPRLRLPLPPRASAAFASFVSAHAGLGSERYLYVDLPEARQAAHGQRAKIGAVVLLDRSHDGPCSIGEIPRAAALRHLIRQNLSMLDSATATIDRLHDLLGDLTCAVLRYSDLDDAVGCLARTFASWDNLSLPDDACAPGDDMAPLRDASPASVDAEMRLVRCGAVSLRRVGDEAFLANGSDDAIYHLNPVGCGVWSLLARPASAREISTTLAAAFADVDPARIERDVDALLGDLLAAGLARPAEG